MCESVDAKEGMPVHTNRRCVTLTAKEQTLQMLQKNVTFPHSIKGCSHEFAFVPESFAKWRGLLQLL